MCVFCLTKVVCEGSLSHSAGAIRPVEQTTKRDRSRVMTRNKVLGLLTVIFIFAGIGFSRLKRNETTQVSKDTVSATMVPLVPPPFELGHEFKTVRGRTWRDRNEAIATVNQVIKFLVQVRNSPELNTEDDRAVWTLIEGYINNPKSLRYGLDFSPNGTWYSARYSCSEKGYFIGSNYLTVTELAMVMYHEMVHEVDCAKKTTPSDATNGERICRFEVHGYAANIRLILALKRHNLLPAEIHGKLGRQNFIDVILEAWPEIARGTFCVWLKAMYQNLQ